MAQRSDGIGALPAANDVQRALLARETGSYVMTPAGPVPQQDPLLTEAQAAYLAAGFLPGAGALEASGEAPEYPTSDMTFSEMLSGPRAASLRENIEEGNYGTATLQGLSVLGDAAMAVPVVGPAAAAVLKGPRALQRALQLASAKQLPAKEVEGLYRTLLEIGYPEPTAAKIAAGELPMDSASKAARMQEQGYTLPQFHGTYASDFTEVDPNMVDLGLHSGSFEQAVQRLRNTADPFGGKTYGDFGYREGANVMPLMIKAENALEMRDVGDWMNSVQVLEGMIGNPKLAHRRNELEALYEEATELQSQFEGGDFLEESFRASQENRELLDYLKDMLREEGYDSVRYKNEVENAYGSQSALRPTAEQARRELSDQISRLENTAMERAPQPPDPDDPLVAEKMREFLDAARQPSAYMTEDELARIKSLKDRYREIGADPKSYNDPFSYISLKGENVRSPYAAYDPDQVDSPNLMAGFAPYAVPAVLGGRLLGAAAQEPRSADQGPGTGGIDALPEGQEVQRVMEQIR